MVAAALAALLHRARASDAGVRTSANTGALAELAISVYVDPRGTTPPRRLVVELSSGQEKGVFRPSLIVTSVDKLGGVGKELA